jgi:thymidylate synthase
MNKLDLDYQNLLKDILENGVKKETRNGGTISVFGRQIRHKMSNGFPLLTTKKMPFKTIVTELLWFLRGDTNIKYLVDNNCHIWDGDAYKNYHKQWIIEEDQYMRNFNSVIPPELVKERDMSKEEFINKIKTDDEFAKQWGELGPIYGKQWRRWNGQVDNISGIGCYHDQIANLINDLKTNPDSRRLMVNAWAVHDLPNMVLPPCHYGFQVYTRELSVNERMGMQIKQNDYASIYSVEEMDKNGIPTRAISLMWNQRSVDTFLGLPFNIASYGLLLLMIADEVNMVPDELIGNLGDNHLYLNHIEQAKEQIGREYTFEERELMLKDAMSWRLYNKAVNELIPFGGGMSEYYDTHKIPYHTKEPFPLPTLRISSGLLDDIAHHEIMDFDILNYQSHPTIKAPLSN